MTCGLQKSNIASAINQRYTLLILESGESVSGEAGSVAGRSFGADPKPSPSGTSARRHLNRASDLTCPLQSYCESIGHM
ncbi:hypothetical protein LB506_001074 [Fusarium annulatum]|nr:hypothetical protein LB506_001074 [Fusarium annulatum]